MKLNESSISMALGVVVVLIVVFLSANYFKGKTESMLNPDNGIATEMKQDSEYTVTKGESLWSIAENKMGDGFKWEELKKANNLTSDTLEIGQKLTIPNANDDQKLEADSQQVQPENYTVMHGDSLWSISVKVYGDGYKWSEIARANSLANPNLIHAGNVLKLPR